MKQVKIFLAFFLMVVTVQIQAQTKPAVVKFKPPRLYTQLGEFRDSSTISVADAESIIGQQLKIFDNKKVVYTVSSYQFLYRKKGVTENEETGKVSPVFTIVSQRFIVSPLPATWVSNIREQVKPGEELFFFDVVAKDTQGRVMYASDLKVFVK